MISSGKTKAAAMIGLILVFASVLLFMQVFRTQESSHWVSLFFIILGEVLPIAGYIWVEDVSGKTMGPGLRVGIYSLFFVYGASAISMSLILLIFGAGPGMLATLEIVLALALAAILYFASIMGGERGRDRAKTMAAVTFMRKLEEDVYALAEEPANQAYASQLRQIGEAVRYGDHSGLTGTDGALTEKVRELNYILRDGDEGEDLSDRERDRQVGLLTEDLLRLLRLRNRELLDEKRARSSNYD